MISTHKTLKLFTALVIWISVITSNVVNAASTSVYESSSVLSKRIEQKGISTFNLDEKLDAAKLLFNTDKTYQSLQLLNSIDENEIKDPLKKCTYFDLLTKVNYKRNNIVKTYIYAQRVISMPPTLCKKEILSAQSILYVIAPQQKEYEKYFKEYLLLPDANVVFISLDERASSIFSNIPQYGSFIKKSTKKDAEWYVLMATLYGQDGDTVKQKEYLKKALKQNSKYIPALMRLALNSDNDESLMYYKKVLEIDPYYFLAENGLGFRLYDIASKGDKSNALESYSEAIKHLERSIKLDPEYPRSYNTLGVIYRITGNAAKSEENFKKAVKYIDRVTRDDPTYIRPIANLALYYKESGNYPLSIEYYQKALKRSPDLTQLLVDLGDIYLKQKKSGKALAVFLKALNVDPQSVEIRLSIAAIFTSQKDYDSAIDVLQEGLDIDPAQTQLSEALSRVRTLQGNNN